MLTKITNNVYDTNYSDVIKKGGAPVVKRKKVKTPDKKSFLDRFIGMFFQVKTNDGVTEQKSKKTLAKDKSLDEQLKELLRLPDDEYKDSMLSSKLRKYLSEIEKDYVRALKEYKQHVAPSFREVKGDTFNVSGVL
jgi:hypothetical protein